MKETMLAEDPQKAVELGISKRELKESVAVTVTGTLAVTGISKRELKEIEPVREGAKRQTKESQKEN